MELHATCPVCGTRFVIAARGRVRVYCSGACKQSAYRSRLLPAELVAADRWVRHISKRPVTVTGTPASSTDSITWASYAAARASRVGDGIGFALGDGFACIDIDHCLVDSKPSAFARSVLARFPDCYVEVSPSGTGLHVWGIADECKGIRADGYEAYSVGRYITVTGNVFRAGGLGNISAAFSR